MGNQNVPEPDDVPFVIEGKLTDLHWELGTENLLAKIDKHYKSKSVVASVGGAVGDMFGQAASAASLAMYDGEDTQNFACRVGDQILWGEFAGAELLPVDQLVKAVVVRKQGALYASAILAPQQGLLWIKHPCGSVAEAKANLKLAVYGFAFGMACWVGAYWLLGLTVSFWEHMTYGVLSALALCAGVAWWANSDMKALAGPSTEMFRMLGFVRPERINLNGYMYFHFHVDEIVQKSISSYRYKNVYCYQAAIDGGKVSMVPDLPAAVAPGPG